MEELHTVMREMSFLRLVGERPVEAILLLFLGLGKVPVVEFRSDPKAQTSLAEPLTFEVELQWMARETSVLRLDPP